MAESFTDVPGVAKDSKRLKKLIDCCEKLQEALGLIRDEEALAEFMEREDLGGAEAATVERVPQLGLRQPPRGTIARKSN